MIFLFDWDMLYLHWHWLDVYCQFRFFEQTNKQTHRNHHRRRRHYCHPVVPRYLYWGNENGWKNRFLDIKTKYGQNFGSPFLSITKNWQAQLFSSSKKSYLLARSVCTMVVFAIHFTIVKSSLWSSINVQQKEKISDGKRRKKILFALANCTN